MQIALALDDRPRVLAEMHRRLWRRFGQPGPWRLLDPVSQLVIGMLGGRTHGEVSRAAYEALQARFGPWEAVRDAPVAVLRRSVIRVTYAEDKAPRLKAALQAIPLRRGRLTLDFLDDLPIEQALAWLERLKGVGRKTSAQTLNFSTLRKPALVIDTHHLRVLYRLGLIDRRADAAKAYDRLMPLLPVDWTAADLDDHHQLVKTLGQTICRHACPACRTCPLQDLCPTATG
jgi:endonuclease-3